MEQKIFTLNKQLRFVRFKTTHQGNELFHQKPELNYPFNENECLIRIGDEKLVPIFHQIADGELEFRSGVLLSPSGAKPIELTIKRKQDEIHVFLTQKPHHNHSDFQPPSNFINNTDIGVIQWESVIGSSIKQASLRVFDILGRDPDTVELYDLNILEAIHPDDLNLFKKGSEALELHQENRVRVRHSRGFYKWVSVRHTLDRSSDTQVYTLMRDITTLVALERSLHESDARQKIAIKGADLGIWDLNLITGKNYVNRRWFEMLGYSFDQDIYSYEFFLSLLHPKDVGIPEEVINHLMQTGEREFSIIIRMRAKDGSYKHILDTGSIASFTPDGQIERMIGTISDITSEIEGIFNLLEQNQKLRKISLEQAHNFRGPLAIALGLIKVIDLKSIDKTPKEDLEDILEGVRESLLEMDDIVQRLNKEMDSSLHNKPLISSQYLDYVLKIRREQQ